MDVNGTLEAGENGIDAKSDALAVAELDQTVSGELDAPGQSNSNSQSATTTGSFTASPTGTNVTAGDDLDGGIEDVEVTVDQDQDDIDQENRSEQFGVADAFASSEHVKVESDGSIVAGDFVAGTGDGIDAESSAVAVADLDQTVDQDNSNSQSATTNLSFTASGELFEPEIEDVEVEVEQEQEDIDQENRNASWNEVTEEWDPGQEGEAHATSTSGDVDVEQSGLLSAAGTGIDAEFERGGCGPA